MKLIRNISVICLAILAISCGGNGNKKTLKLYNSELSKDYLSEEIVEKYGDPQEKWQDKYGNQIFSYSYSKAVLAPSSFFFLPITTSKFNNYEIILVFNKNNRLINFNKFHDQMSVRPWTLCENSVVNCDLGYKSIARK